MLHAGGSPFCKAREWPQHQCRQDTRWGALPPKRYTPNTITDLDQLLEELALTRTRGFAIDDEENQVGLRCIGAPVRDAAGRVFAAVSVSGPTERMPDVRLEGLAPLVIQTARDISEALA